MAADLKGLIETVARALADQPDAVSVKESDRRVSLDIRDQTGRS